MGGEPGRSRDSTGGRSFAVDADLLPLLQGSSELSRRSHGLFDPAIGRLTELWLPSR